MERPGGGTQAGEPQRSREAGDPVAVGLGLQGRVSGGEKGGLALRVTQRGPRRVGRKSDLGKRRQCPRALLVPPGPRRALSCGKQGDKTCDGRLRELASGGPGTRSPYPQGRPERGLRTRSLSTCQEGTAYLPKGGRAAGPQGQRQAGAGEGACGWELNGPEKKT